LVGGECLKVDWQVLLTRSQDESGLLVTRGSLEPQYTQKEAPGAVGEPQEGQSAIGIGLVNDTDNIFGALGDGCIYMTALSATSLSTDLPEPRSRTVILIILLIRTVVARSSKLAPYFLIS